MPRESFPAFARGAFAFRGDLGDFNAATAVNIVDSYNPGFICYLEGFEVTVDAADWAGAGGTLTFDLRNGGPTGTIIATLTTPLASMLRGATVRASVSAANANLARLGDTGTFSITRQATGTVFTTASGTWKVLFRARQQARQ